MARVLFVDDDEHLCRAVVRLLRHDHEVVTASSVAEAERVLDARAFHVVFLDLLMPGRGGGELLPRLQALDPPPLVAVISAHIPSVHAIALSGWRGMVLPKPISPEVIWQVVEQAESTSVARSNEAASEAELDARLIADFSAEAATRPLSPRQVKVVAGCYAGKTIEEIADELGIEASTVRMHLQRAEGKVPGCHSLGQLMATVARFAARRRPAK